MFKKDIDLIVDELSKNSFFDVVGVYDDYTLPPFSGSGNHIFITNTSRIKFSQVTQKNEMARQEFGIFVVTDCKVDITQMYKKIKQQLQGIYGIKIETTEIETNSYAVWRTFIQGDDDLPPRDFNAFAIYFMLVKPFFVTNYCEYIICENDCC